MSERQEEWQPSPLLQRLYEIRSTQQIVEDAELCKQSLTHFIKSGWNAFKSEQQYVHNWHIDAVCYHLEAVTNEEIKRLQVWIPPGTSKSATVSVFWPAWEWCKLPWIRYWGASYETRFAARLAAMSRDLMLTEWYQQRFGDVFSFVRDAEGYFTNNKGGTRLATSPESTGTGEHGHRILIDDPINAMEAEANSKTELLKANTWYDSQVNTRGLDIGYKHARVLIMQRLHEEDLAAHMLELDGWSGEGGKWEVLCLPERYEKKHPFVWPDDPRDPDKPPREGIGQGEGALLWPAQRNEESSDALARVLRPHRAAGQLQQRPAAKEGDRLKASWWRFYDPRIREKDKWNELPIVPSSVVISVDCPQKDKETNDNIAIQVWAVNGLYRYLLDLELSKMNYSKAKRRVAEMATWARVTWPKARHVILIENTGYGSDLILDIKDQFTGIKKINPQQDGDKEVRADRASEYLEDGYCFLPGFGPGWKNEAYDSARTPKEVADFIENCARFPNASHDDDVDAWSQAMNWLRANTMRALKTSSAAKRSHRPRAATATTSTRVRRQRRSTR